MKDLEQDLVDAIEEASREVMPKWFIASTYEFQAGEFNYLFKEELNLPNSGLILYGKGGAVEKEKLSVQVVRVGMKNRIHGKIILGQGKGRVFLAIGSANLTRAGLEGGNIEICNVFSNPPYRLACSAATWLLKRLEVFTHAPPLEWKAKLEAIKRMTDIKVDEDSSAEWFDNDDESIAVKIKKHIGQKHVSQLTIISPYLNGKAIKRLSEQYSLKPGSVKIVIPSKIHESSRIVEQMDCWKGRLFQLKEDNRFPHAKILLFEYLNGGLLIYGSANATNAGLFSTVNAKRAMAECMVGIRLNKKDLQKFRGSILSVKIPKTDNLKGTEVKDDDEDESPPSDLWAWYRPDGSIEVWPPKSKSAETHSTLPVVSIRGSRKKYILGLGEKVNLFILKDEKVITKLNDNWPDDGVSIKWGEWSGDVYCLDNQVDPEDSVATLWGGDELPAESGGVGGGRKRDSTGITNGEPKKAELDEYEKKSLLVVKNIWPYLSARYPCLDILRELEKKDNLKLGCKIDDEILDGCSFFLWTRLLARWKRENSGNPLHPHSKEELVKIRKTVNDLRKRLFKNKLKKYFNKWQHSDMWLERAKISKVAKA